MNKAYLLEVAKMNCTGEMTDEEAHSIIQLAGGKDGILKHGDQLPVLDVEGNALIAGNVYENEKGERVLVQKATYGQGNIMDTYYRVHYLIGSDFKEEFKVVDGKGSIFSGFTYQSNFKPV